MYKLSNIFHILYIIYKLSEALNKAVIGIVVIYTYIALQSFKLLIIE